MLLRRGRLGGEDDSGWDGARQVLLAQLVGGEDLIEVLASQRLALQRVGGEVVEALAVARQQRPRPPVCLTRQRHRRHVDVAAGGGAERRVAPPPGAPRRPPPAPPPAPPPPAAPTPP